MDAEVVVGAALVRDGSLLIAQRSYPSALAGRWELPGGRVEPGEPEVRALVRECREELDVDVAVGSRVGADVELRPGLVLRVYAAHLVRGEPRAVEHRALRWVGAVDLDAVDWLDADRVLVPALVELFEHQGW